MKFVNKCIFPPFWKHDVAICCSWDDSGCNCWRCWCFCDDNCCRCRKAKALAAAASVKTTAIAAAMQQLSPTLPLLSRRQLLLLLRPNVASKFVISVIFKVKFWHFWNKCRSQGVKFESLWYSIFAQFKLRGKFATSTYRKNIQGAENEIIKTIWRSPHLLKVLIIKWKWIRTSQILTRSSMHLNLEKYIKH